MPCFCTKCDCPHKVKHFPLCPECANDYHAEIP